MKSMQAFPLFLSLFACTSQKSQTHVLAEPNSTFTCPAGFDPIIYSLTPPILDDSSSFKDRIIGVDNYNKSDKLNSVVFKMCTDYSTQTTIAELIILSTDPIRSTTVLSSEISIQEGLQSLPFYDTKSLKLLAKLKSGEDLLIIGGPDNVVAVAWGVNSVSGPFKAKLAMLGSLSSGNAASACFGSAGEGEVRVAKVKAGSAEFSFGICTGGFGTSGSFPYSIVEATVKDSNLLLGKMANIERSLKGADFAAQVKVKYLHHNVCDSVNIQFDDVSYILLSVGGVGDGKPCEENVKIPAKNPSSTFGLYKFTYPNNVIEQGYGLFDNVYDDIR